MPEGEDFLLDRLFATRVTARIEKTDGDGPVFFTQQF